MFNSRSIGAPVDTKEADTVRSYFHIYSALFQVIFKLPYYQLAD
jgi:hypothetical protein